MRTHELKTWPTYFEAILRGEKRFELRKNDRDFGVGDVLRLQEFDPGKTNAHEWHKYTDREIWARVTYIKHGGEMGLEAGHCIMNFEVIEKPDGKE